jgi:uncharacterized spore protein YtfJ
MQSEEPTGSEAVTNSGSAEGFVASLAEKLGATARAATVFGDPVERDGVTVIPVARARWGYGGGAGKRRDEDGAGGGEAQFRPIRSISFHWLMLGGLAGMFLLRRVFGRK